MEGHRGDGPEAMIIGVLVLLVVFSALTWAKERCLLHHPPPDLVTYDRQESWSQGHQSGRVGPALHTVTWCSAQDSRPCTPPGQLKRDNLDGAGEPACEGKLERDGATTCVPCGRIGEGETFSHSPFVKHGRQESWPWDHESRRLAQPITCYSTQENRHCTSPGSRLKLAVVMRVDGAGMLALRA